MKPLVLAVLLAITFPVLAQTELPNVKIRTLTGKEVKFNTLFAQTDTAIIVSLWATWCNPCLAELEAINEKYASWQKEVPFRFLAISIDDARTAPKVRAFVKGRGWEFEYFLDTNNELKRALNATDIPYVMIIKNGEIIYQHTGYAPGNEDILFKKIKGLTK